MPVRTGAETPRQRHAGATKFDPDKFEENKVSTTDAIFLKPSGGFWTSSVREDVGEDDFATDWEWWSASNQCKYSKDCFDVIPDADAKIFTIETPEDVEEIIEKYGEYEEEYYIDGDGNLKTRHKQGQLVKVDWVEFAKEYDALRVNEEMAQKYHLSMIDVGCMHTSLNSWDAESTCWFKPKFKEVSREEF